MNQERRQDYMKRELVDYMTTRPNDERCLAVMHCIRPGIVFEKFGPEGAKALEDVISKNLGAIEEGKVWNSLLYGQKVEAEAIDKVIGNYSDELRSGAARDMTLWMAERFADYELCLSNYPALAVKSWGEVMLGNLEQIQRLNAGDKNVEYSLDVMKIRLRKHLEKLRR